MLVIWYCGISGYVEKVRVLTENGANVNAENEYKETPIYFSVNSGKFVRNLFCSLLS